MQCVKTLSLAAVAACAALVTNDAQANPLSAVGSAVNRSVSYVAAPVAGYNCANGVCRPVAYGAGGSQTAPTGYCSGPNCSVRQTVPYGYSTPTYTPSGNSCPGGTCGQPVYGYGYRYGYPAGVSYYSWPVVNPITPTAPVYAAPISSGQPAVSAPIVQDPNQTPTNGPAQTPANAGVDTTSPFYP